MEFYEILLDIMGEKNLSIPDVARATGLSDSTIRSIINRKQSTIALSVAFKISDGLNVPIECLDGADQEKHTGVKITSTEQCLLENYRSLNEEGQEKIVDYVDDIARSGKYKKDNHSEMGNQKQA